MRLPVGILFVASRATADESLIDIWMLEGSMDSITIQEDGTVAREVSIDVETFLAPADLGFSDDPAGWRGLGDQVLDPGGGRGTRRR